MNKKITIERKNLENLEKILKKKEVKTPPNMQIYYDSIYISNSQNSIRWNATYEIEDLNLIFKGIGAILGIEIEVVENERDRK